MSHREVNIVLSGGRIVDVNRRFTCLSCLIYDNPEFNWFETVILDETLKTIKENMILQKIPFDLSMDFVGNLNS